MGKSSGGVLIEFLITLPIFLIIILSIVWISAIHNAHTSLDFAVANGVRLAVTRGDPEITSEFKPGMNRLIDKVTDAKISSDVTFKQIFVNDPKGDVNYAPSKAIISSLPTTHRLALGLTYQYMRESVGSMVKFPCDPEDETEPDKKKLFGCLNCFFRVETLDGGGNPICYAPLTRFPEGKKIPEGCTPIGSTTDLPKKYMSLSCRYLPDDLFLKIIGTLLGSKAITEMPLFFHVANTRQEMPAKNWIYDD